jgi:uncharacterized phage protein (TIGR01671 family)
MNKVIKFRFYSKILDKFVLPLDKLYIGALKDPGMVVTQFTGLKDKDGKDIFEGDVLKSYYEDTLSVVEQYNGHIYTKTLDKWLIAHGCTSPVLLFHGCCYEVIGNIFESKEYKSKRIGE